LGAASEPCRSIKKYFPCHVVPRRSCALCPSTSFQCFFGGRAVYLHHLPQVLAQLGLDPELAHPQLSHIIVSSAFLLLPGCIALSAHGLGSTAQALMPLFSGILQCSQISASMRLFLVISCLVCFQAIIYCPQHSTFYSCCDMHAILAEQRAWRGNRRTGRVALL
jgi:hypothetical protein